MMRLWQGTVGVVPEDDLVEDELYPHFSGLGSGIRDKFGNELEFPAAFRQCRRDSQPKGIVKLMKEIPK